MSETAFPVNDLLRRRLQTGLTIISLTTCVAATLFLLLFSDQISSGMVATSQNTLTIGFLNIFSQLIFFVGILVFAVGAVIVSFVVFLMTKQRTQDYGLMRATGCPNGLIFGYFFTELLLVTALGCILGILLGFAANYVIINLSGISMAQQSLNFWYAPLVFVVFFVFALIFGAKPMFDTARMSPVNAMSNVHYLSLNKVNKFKVLSKSRLTLNLATRSLFRRQSATIRLVIFLSLVFTLLTVSIAGSVIAQETTTSWLERANAPNTLLIAHREMSVQYLAFLSKFSSTNQEVADFDYFDAKLSIPDVLLQQLSTLPEVKTVDPRMAYQGAVQEVGNYTFDPETLATIPVGGHREGNALIVGVDPQKVSSNWFVKGQFLSTNTLSEAVIGDAIAQSMYSPDLSQKINVADPLLQSVRLQDTTFRIVGTCVEPLNNGFVVYVPLEKLVNLTGVNSANILIVQLESPINPGIMSQITQIAVNMDANLTVVDLSDALQENMSFLSSRWSVVMLVPMLCLTAAIFSLIAFLLVSINEQHHEFAVLRATGMKPKTVANILVMQSLLVLLSSFGVGISIGTTVTLLILMREPVITAFSVLQISGWLVAALFVVFLVSLYPAINFSKKPILKIMS